MASASTEEESRLLGNLPANLLETVFAEDKWSHIRLTTKGEKVLLEAVVKGNLVTMRKADDNRRLTTSLTISPASHQ